MSLEFYPGANAGAERNVVIDFTVDSEYDFAIFANQGLCTGVCSDMNHMQRTN